MKPRPAPWTAGSRYTTNLVGQSPEFVIDAYHQLGRSSAASACPSTTRGPARSTTAPAKSIYAHLTIVFAALAVGNWIEHQTGSTIKEFVGAARRYRTVTIHAGRQTLTAAEPIPDALAKALARIRGSGAHISHC